MTYKVNTTFRVGDIVTVASSEHCFDAKSVGRTGKIIARHWMVAVGSVKEAPLGTTWWMVEFGKNDCDFGRDSELKHAEKEDTSA